jgi:acyl-CoA synthetase (AMP-forming)/AMP-acid ligase II
MLIEPEMPEPHAFVRRPSTVAEIVPFWAEHAPERIALIEGGRSYTYRQLDRAVHDAAGMLVRVGIRPGDRAMLVCENSLAAVIVYLASTSIEAWPVIVNARLSDREIDEIRDHSGARRVIYTTAASMRAKAHATRHGAVMADLPMGGEIAVGPLNEGAEPEPIRPDVTRQVAALIYTTGTTGRPKGVMLTHGNLMFVARESSEIRGLGAEDRVYGILPISHILGLTGVLISSLLSGAQIHLTPRFDPAAALAAIAQDRISVIIGTPAMYAMLSEYAARNRLAPVKGPSLRLISAAGAPLDAATKTAAEKTFGLTLHNGYGITETAPTLTLTRLDSPRTDCSVGKFLPGIEADVRGPDGVRIADGEAGELFIRGPGVMKGYYKAAAETAEAIDAAGWFRTGDLVRIDDGHVFIVGRAKELIIRFGFNVYPAEIEAVLNAIPGVARSAVVGRQAQGGEEVVAFVQMAKETTTTIADIAAQAAHQLAPYKRPSTIVPLPALPASPTGKILKSELAAMAKTSALSA